MNKREIVLYNNNYKVTYPGFSKLDKQKFEKQYDESFLYVCPGCTYNSYSSCHLSKLGVPENQWVTGATSNLKHWKNLNSYRDKLIMCGRMPPRGVPLKREFGLKWKAEFYNPFPTNKKLGISVDHVLKLYQKYLIEERILKQEEVDFILNDN